VSELHISEESPVGDTEWKESLCTQRAIWRTVFLVTVCHDKIQVKKHVTVYFFRGIRYIQFLVHFQKIWV